MGVLAVVAEGAEGAAEVTPPWVYGISAFAILAALLVVTMMIKVGR